MIVVFEEVFLRELYEKGKSTDKKHRFQPDIIRRYQRSIDVLLNARDIESLYPFTSLHYEVLQGDKAGLSSIRVNKQYRIEFFVRRTDKEPVITICHITSLSNHYK